MIRLDTALDWLEVKGRNRKKITGRFPHTVGFEELKEISGELDLAPPFSIVTVGIERGGVGKSAMTVNLAAFLAMRGLRVLVLDYDPQACTTNFLLPDNIEYSGLITMLELFSGTDRNFTDAAIETRLEGVWMIPSKPEVRIIDRTLTGKAVHEKLDKLFTGCSEMFDLVIIDTPPSYSDRVAAAYVGADLVLIPVLPDVWTIESIALTIEDVESTSRELKCRMPDVRLVFNRFNPRRRAGIEGESIIRKEYGDILLPQTISESASVQNLLNEGLTFLNAGYGKVRDEYAELARLVSKRLKEISVNERTEKTES